MPTYHYVSLLELKNQFNLIVFLMLYKLVNTFLKTLFLA